MFAAWAGLYDGRLVADDIRDLARDLVEPDDGTMVRLLGDHENLAGATFGADTVAGLLADALKTALKAMNGSGVFRSPKGRGIGADAYCNEVRAADTAVDRWRRETYAVLRRHLLPDPRSIAREPSSRSFALPVLSPGDRRAALRSLWSPFLPDARWETEHHRARRLGSRLSRRQRLHECGDAACRRVAREAVDLHPPTLLGVQQRGRAGAHRAGTPDRRHDRRHQHELRPGPRVAHASRGPQSSSPTATSRHSVRSSLPPPPPARACTSSSRATAIRPCCSAPACHTHSYRGCHHDPHE